MVFLDGCSRGQEPVVFLLDLGVAEMRVENGKVAEVLSLTGPAVFHPVVSQALIKYECDRLDKPVLATQSFDF